MDQSVVVSRFLGIHARASQNRPLLDSVKAEKVNNRRDKWSPVLAGCGSEYFIEMDRRVGTS